MTNESDLIEAALERERALYKRLSQTAEIWHSHPVPRINPHDQIVAARACLNHADQAERRWLADGAPRAEVARVARLISSLRLNTLTELGHLRQCIASQLGRPLDDLRAMSSVELRELVRQMPALLQARGEESEMRNRERRRLAEAARGPHMTVTQLTGFTVFTFRR